MTSTWIWKRGARARFAAGPEGESLLAYARANQVAAFAGGAFFLLPFVFLLAALLHSRAIGGAGVLVVSLCLALSAAAGAFKVRWVWRRGAWTGWKGEPVERSRQPGRYWTWTALHSLTPVISAAAALFLAWVGLGLLSGRWKP